MYSDMPVSYLQRTVTAAPRKQPHLLEFLVSGAIEAEIAELRTEYLLHYPRTMWKLRCEVFVMPISRGCPCSLMSLVFGRT
jgi:hypothetical protein